MPLIIGMDKNVMIVQRLIQIATHV